VSRPLSFEVELSALEAETERKKDEKGEESTRGITGGRGSQNRLHILNTSSPCKSGEKEARATTKRRRVKTKHGAVKREKGSDREGGKGRFKAPSIPATGPLTVRPISLKSQKAITKRESPKGGETLSV